jgi:thiol-disulfide isomerase/thioredoxin
MLLLLLLCKPANPIVLQSPKHLSDTFEIWLDDFPECCLSCCHFPQVVEIQDLEHLESLLDKAGSSLVVVAFYTRSCGVCKELLKEFQSMCDEAKAAQVSVRFYDEIVFTPPWCAGFGCKGCQAAVRQFLVSMC